MLRCRTSRLARFAGHPSPDRTCSFVEKAGPVFRFQDAAEKIITWENPLVTMLVGAIYAFLCPSPLDSLD